MILLSFFFNVSPSTELYTLSLHDALPISPRHDHVAQILRHALRTDRAVGAGRCHVRPLHRSHGREDRKSTRLNSSHSQISYAVFCLKKKRGILLEKNTDMYVSVADFIICW